MSGLLAGLKGKRDDLESRIAALDGERKPLKNKMSDLGKQLGVIDRQMEKLRAQKADLSAQIGALSIEPSVSDHAVVRYLERRYGFSFDDIRSEMLTPLVVEAMKSGVRQVNALNGSLKISGMKVVTFVPKS